MGGGQFPGQGAKSRMASRLLVPLHVSLCPYGCRPCWSWGKLPQALLDLVRVARPTLGAT